MGVNVYVVIRSNANQISRIICAQMAVTIFISRLSSQSIFYLFYILFLLPHFSKALNFDLRNPIVIHDSFDKAESHFGASVTLVTPDIGTGWILIAAPKAESPLQNYSHVKEPGHVWRCSLGLDEANNCSILQIDAFGEFDAKIGKVPLQMIHRDRKDYGMLGSSMVVGRGSSDRFVVCSSRWTNQKYKDHHLMNGLCYWLPKTNLFMHNSTFLDFSHRLLPIVNSSRQAYTLATLNGQPVERRFDWAFGQAGFSIDLSEKNELLLGAPGILEWAGSVVQYRDWDPIKLNPPYRRFNQKDAIFAQILVPRTQTLINKNILNYFDYFGYAVTSGHFFNLEHEQTQYAAGAPRGNSLAGKVLFFQFKENPSDSEQISPDESLHFLVEPIIGTSTNFFGSYFGSTLSALDINGDGFDDLLIGAPLYETTLTTFTESTSSNNSDTSDNLLSSGDEGCVFVYFSLGNDFKRDHPQEVCGDSRPGARFGSSICPLGDINHDTFQDVAIGAPYEAENRGSVYIYIGSEKKLILSQKITPEDLEVPFRGFGFSLSGGIDVDQNAYGDLAIGAYESNHVVIYRSFAVVDLSGNLSTSVTALSSGTGLFSITACLSFRGHNISEELEIWMKLSLDPEFRKTRIVEFLLDDRVQTENFFKNTIQFHASYQAEGTCHTFNVTTVGDLDLVTIPVTVRQDIWLEVGEEPHPRPIYYELTKSNEGYPTLKGRAENQKFFWRPKHPIIQFSASKTVTPKFISIPITAICEDDGDPNCLADLSLNASFRTTEGTFFRDNEEFVIGSSRSVVLQIELSNHRERANLPLTIDISWHGPPIIRSSKSDCVRRDNMLTQSNDDKVYTCTLLTPLSKKKKETLELELDMTGLYAGAGEVILQFQLVANTSSLLVNDAILSIQLPLTHKSQLVFLGQQAEASYYDNITAATVNFTQLYEVGLTGVSPIYGIHIQVALPASIYIDGTIVPLLRVREPLLTYDGAVMNCGSINGTFYEEISYEDIDIGRVKRDNNRLPKKKLTLIEQPITINCQTPSVECFWVECEALFFKPSYRALVEFRLRLVTETARKLFMEKERDVMIIETVSRLKRLGFIEETKFAVSRTLIRAELEGEIKAWILIVATGGGFILFTLITLVLTHCGFFRRTKLEELAKLKARQRGMGEYLFDDLEVVDSLEYYDVALTESDFDYRYEGTQFRPNESSFSDGLYDELQLKSN